MLITERAAAIRRELKEKFGWTCRHVGVRARRGGTLSVTIKDPSVREPAVRQIAERYRSVRYDEMTGCILRGGNIFVHVAWARPLVKAMIDRLPLDQIGDAGQDVEIGPVCMWRHQDNAKAYSFKVDGVECHYMPYHDLRSLGEGVALTLLSNGLTLDEPDDNSGEPASARDDEPKLDTSHGESVAHQRTGWVGLRYERERDTKDIARRIRSDIRDAVQRRALPRGKYVVRISRYSMGRSIDVTVRELHEPVLIANPDRVRQDLRRPDVNEPLHPLLSAPGREIIETLQSICSAYNRDVSDPLAQTIDRDFFSSIQFSGIRATQARWVESISPELRVRARHWRDRDAA